MYVPAFDDWDDLPGRAEFFGIPLVLPFGYLSLQTIVGSNNRGLTLGDRGSMVQVMVGHMRDHPVTKGATLMKFSHSGNQWEPMTPPRDAIYSYSDEADAWEVITPPGKDVMQLSTDEGGTTYVQTGEIRPASLSYLVNIMTSNFSNIEPQTDTTALHKLVDGEWVSIPDPPARFYDKNTGQLVDEPYPGTRGAFLAGLEGGEAGELYVINSPSSSSLVDTIYRYTDGGWEVVPSPPNSYYDATGNVVERDELPSRVEVGVGAEGELVVRVPSPAGADGIFTRTDGSYEMLSVVEAEGGPIERTLAQMTVGKKQVPGRGSYVVTATYF